MADILQKNITTRIVLRNDSTSAWEAVKETAVLLKGEVGIEFLSNGKVKMKIGDGVSTWSELSYFGGAEAHIFETEVASGADHETAIAAVATGELAVGDIAIVKETIGGSDKVAHTAYVYDIIVVDGVETGKWVAMDGNYSAANVYLPNDITLAGDFTSIGNYAKGKKIEKGTSLEALFSGMLQQELDPTASIPTASISVSGGSGEVGSSYTLPTATLTINSVGSYTYGPETGITFAIGDVELKQGSNSKTNDAVMAKDSTLKLQATDTATLYTDSSKSYTFSATATHTGGAVPVTNLGNEFPSAQISSGSITIENKTATFSGYRKAFAGGTTAATIDSATVRAMTATKTSFSSMDSESEALEFTAAAGATKVFFAYPSTWSVGNKKPNFQMFGLAWGDNSDIVAKDDVQVADARGTVDGELQGPVAYKLYAWELDTPLQAETTKFRVWFK